MNKLMLILLGAVCAQFAVAQSAAPHEETKEQRDARMAWWREAKFGMFIHWGVYSVPAGYYNGKPVPGIGEWIMNHGKIPMADYQAFAKDFNPVKFNADDWVKVAKDAGMKYIVITSKHHDGFAMFPSKASKWNIMDATPFGRDPLAELAAACRKQGIKLGFYYSQAQDWNNGGAAIGGKWDKAQEHDMDDYIDKIAVPQVREILTNYGDDVPAVLWWDTPIEMTKERAQKLHDVVEQVKPNIIMNNRLGGGFKGDTETPEQHIPAQGYPGEDWETCMTMNNTWGFKKDDNNWKSTETLIRNLCDIASKGGNYLLNVGPTSEGLFPQASIDRLAEVGKWMKVNGDSIYGTGPTPFGGEAGAYSSTQKDKKGQPVFIPAWQWRATTKPGKVYIQIFQWPADGKFVVPMTNAAKSAYMLANPGTKLDATQSDTGLTVTLPAKAPDPIASVLAIEIEGAPQAIANAGPAPTPAH
jgi:alpha-L-fucosidase